VRWRCCRSAIHTSKLGENGIVDRCGREAVKEMSITFGTGRMK